MPNNAEESAQKLVRTSSVIFPLGIRAGHTNDIMIIDFLDPELPGEIIKSVALTKDTAASLLRGIQGFLGNDD